MGDKKPIDLSFPVKGLDENWAYKAQPQGTSPDCLNVRPYDVLGQRQRGGQRAGLSKYFADGLGDVVQRFGNIVTNNGVGAYSYTISTDPLVYDFSGSGGGGVTGTGTTNPNDWQGFDTNGNPVTPGPTIVGGQAVGNNDIFGVGAVYKSPIDMIGVNVVNSTITFHATPTTIPNFTLDGLAVHYLLNYDSSSDIHTNSGINAGVRFYNGNIIFDGIIQFTPLTPGSNDYLDPAWWNNTPRQVMIIYDGTNLTYYADGNQIATAAYPLTPPPLTQVYNGFYLANMYNNVGTSGNTVSMNLFGTQAVTGGTSGCGGGGVGGLGGGSGGVTLTRTYENQTMVLVSQGNVYYSTGKAVGWALATGGTGAVSNLPSMVKTITAFNKIYFIDGTYAGYKYFDPATKTVYSWAPTVPAFATGTSLPTDSTKNQGATIGAVYNGRIVLAGLPSDPQDWFMSAAGEVPAGSPSAGIMSDWNYGAVPFTATSAVAGNNSDAGKIGDAITCLAPFNDDLLVIGGVQSIWLMRGDPANGGRIDAISRSIGIIGPDAWCLDAQGNMYFFGGGVFYRMAPAGASTMYSKTLGGLPEPLSRGRLDAVFGAIDASSSQVLLLWDETLQGVHIYITPLTSGASTHYWWDARTDSFWPERYPDICGPSSVMVYQSPASLERACLLGGQDGFVRAIDPAALTDDGTTILSRAKIGPLTADGVQTDSKLSRVTTVLDADSGPVAVRVYAAESPEEVAKATTPVWSYMASPVDRYSIPRISGNALMVELQNDSFSSIWVTGHAYAIGDQVVAADGNPYVSLTAHTSTASLGSLPFWATGHVYAVGDQIKSSVDGLAYAALTAHTSTTGGANDTPPGIIVDWALLPLYPTPAYGANTTDWVLSAFRTWALESISIDLETTGRTRHRRI